MNKKASIVGIEYSLPTKKLTNEDLVKDFPEWDVCKISSKTGINARHIAAKYETALDLGESAANKLLCNLKVERSEIDFVIFCTQTPDYQLPPNSCLLQERLSLSPSVGVIDISHGCAGFIYNLFIAKVLIETGQAKKILCINADTYSQLLNKKDRSTRTIFGDAAACTFVAEQGCYKDQGQIGNFSFMTDGRGKENLIVPASGARRNEVIENDLYRACCTDGMRSIYNLYMNGNAILQYASSIVPELYGSVLKSNNISMKEIDKFVFHQANSFMLEFLRNKCRIPKENFFVDIGDIGNTVSASIPIAIRRALERNFIKANDKVCMLGFGVGYAAAGCVVEF